MLKLIVSIFTITLFLNSASANDNKPTDVVEKEWTFLLFLNGHNNLDSFGAFNINQMEEIGSTDDLNLVVQWASLDNGDTKRLYIQKDADIENVTSPAVETLKPVDMGDYKKLVEFVEWGVKNYPAKHYMIAVWNHGSGWHRLRSDSPSRDISSDDLTGHVITTEQLALAMEESAKIIGHKVDIYGSDACLMAMIEIAAEMQSSVDYMVASVYLEPGEGWPYNKWIKRWADKPDATAAEVSKYLSQEYVRAYDVGGIYDLNEATFSAMDLSKLPQLNDAIKNLASSLSELSPNEIALTKKAKDDALEYFYGDYRDLGMFVDNLSKSNSSIKTSLLTNVKDAMKNVVIDNGGTSYFTETQGISIWLPSYLNNYEQRYSKLKFNQSTDWLKYLKLIAQ